VVQDVHRECIPNANNLTSTQLQRDRKEQLRGGMNQWAEV